MEEQTMHLTGAVVHNHIFVVFFLVSVAELLPLVLFSNIYI